jgi:hypothetical protein
LGEFTVDLKEYIDSAETALVGRDNGKSLRLALSSRGLKLDQLESNHSKINIVIPEHIVSMNRSYFLGAFADRARALGKTTFLEKYQFQTSEHIQNKIQDHIDYALKNTTPDEILNV